MKVSEYVALNALLHDGGEPEVPRFIGPPDLRLDLQVMRSQGQPAIGEHWRAKWTWPKGDKARIYVGEAVDRVGSAMFGPEWTNAVFSCRVGLPTFADVLTRTTRRPPIKPPKPAPLVADPRCRSQTSMSASDPLQARAAYVEAMRIHGQFEGRAVILQPIWQRLCETNLSLGRMLFDAIEWLGERGRNGDLATSIRLQDARSNGAYREVDATFWNVDHQMDQRFRDGAFDYRFTPGLVSLQKCYAFVERADLDRQLGTLNHASATVASTDLATFSDCLRFAVALARKWKCDRDWKPPKQDALVADILSEWVASSEPERLTPNMAANIAFVLKGNARR